MFRNTFLKTLYEKRWTIFWWAFAVALSNILLIQLFPAIRDAFSGMAGDMPGELAGWFGAGNMWNSIEGYVGLEIMGQMVLIVIVFGVVFATSIFASEESSGQLATNFSRPIGRTGYFLQKFAALCVAMFAVMLAFYVGAIIGTLVLNEPIDIWNFAVPCFAAYLLAMCFASLTFALNAAIGSKVIGGIVAGFYATFSYFMYSMNSASEVVKNLSMFGPHYFYQAAEVMENGLEIGNVAVLLLFIIVPLVIALPIFQRRDIGTK